MPFRRRPLRRARSTNDPTDADSMEPGSSSVAGAARAATPVALTALFQSTDVFPPLKSALSFLLQVHDICEKMKSNRGGADELRVRVEGVRDFVVEAFQDEEDMCLELYNALIQFDDALMSILVAVDDVRYRKSRLLRLAFSARDTETLRLVKQRLDDATKLLMLIVTLQQSKTLHSMSRTVSRVEGLVFEVGYMRAQLTAPRTALKKPALFFFHISPLDLPLDVIGSPVLPNLLTDFGPTL
ncbi:hypothetical protein BD410DRAFT_795538 [Rickenella mellea]|uniref:Mixed lineage kinase domain-containing protein n=1 Tax=Rickenella mellea TaxID=50990 RepID=A0A4Y7PLF6_9AGAM|nr:hypothetical protein BD410DRAFT_795538 [Rickenella mellea]